MCVHEQLEELYFQIHHIKPFSLLIYINLIEKSNNHFELKYLLELNNSFFLIKHQF